MPEPLVIAALIRLDPGAIRQLEALDPRIEVRDFGDVMRGPGPDPAQKSAVLEALRDAEVMIGSNRLPVEYFDAAPRLRWFQAMNAGLERLDASGVLRRGFAVTNGSGLAAPAISEWVVAAMFALAKQFPAYGRNQAAHRWNRVPGGVALEGKTCGILGLGAIGRETARRARALGMRVIASRRTAGGDDPDCDLLLPHGDLHGLLAESDFVVICLPLTGETQGLIDREALAAMKPTASLINIARGGIVDQDALCDALRDGVIASAALDVTTPEPLPADSLLWDLPNLLITPHTSGASDRRDGTATSLLVENVGRYLAGLPLRNLARPDLGY